MMWDVRACRACLNTEAQLYPLRANRLEQHFQVLIGENLDREMGLPQYLCWECSALVHKYYHFRQRCLQGQITLLDIYGTHNEVTLEEIKKVDRRRCKLSSPYVTFHTPAAEFVHSYLYSGQFLEVKVKEEEQGVGEAAGAGDTAGAGDAAGAAGTVEAGSGTEASKDFLEVEVKEEDKQDGYTDSFADFASLTAYSSTEDDEPLSRQRSKADPATEHLQNAPNPAPEVKKKKREVKRRKRKEVKEEIKEPKVLKKRKPAEENLEPKVPKKRGPKPSAKSRDEAEMEDYVTIMKLTMAEQMQEVLNRKNSSNYKNAPLKCDICFKGFVDNDAFGNHIVKHEPERGDIECPVCKFRFQTKRTLQKHAANHEKKYQCKSCPYISKTTTQAKQHQKWHKGITYKCQYCDEVSTKWTSYLSHVRIKHPSEHICGVCGYSFVSKLGLAMHKTMMHKEAQKFQEKPREKEESVKSVGPYCKDCDVQFATRQAYKRHMVTSAKHTMNNDFGNGCRVCGETFPTAEELRVHHRKQHARKRPKNYGKKPSDIVWPIKCEHCEDQIPNARDYWTHFRRVHPDKKYPIKKSFVCEICGKEFRGNAFLVYHKRTHFEERMYKCGQCNKSFFNRTNLMMHEKTHSDHRPYPCTVCFKAFKLKGALDRHFRSHTGVKPYECEFCGKAFGQSNSRKLHIRTVHLKQPAPYISKSRLERRRVAAEAVKIVPPFPY